MGTQMSSMPHLVVVLPGILGSVLEKNGREVWGASSNAFFQGLLSRGKSIQDLKVTQDSSTSCDLGDGVKATKLFPDLHIVPGFWKIDGYSRLCEALTERFELLEYGAHDITNLIKFAYDWRRDNRSSARKLKEAIDLSLGKLREANPEAKVILIAHSMGGLVARYYLECLSGWRDCLALITLGTPFRGAPKAIGYLTNGYRQCGLDVTEFMRSCRSVYQLLPFYKCIKSHGEWKRVVELAEPIGLDLLKVQDGYCFHKEIEDAVNKNRLNPDFIPYKIFPFVGVSQPTEQHAVWDGTHLTCSLSLPDDWPAGLDGGDGTVPRASATPIEVSKDALESFAIEMHGSLQNRPSILDDVIARIEQMISSDSLANIRGYAPSSSGNSSGFSIRTDDIVFLGDDIVVDIAVVNARKDAMRSIDITVVNRRTNESWSSKAQANENGWRFTSPCRGTGVYEIIVSSDAPGVSPLRDVVEVVER